MTKMRVFALSNSHDWQYHRVWPPAWFGWHWLYVSSPISPSTHTINWNGHGRPRDGGRGHDRQRPWFPCNFRVRVRFFLCILLRKWLGNNTFCPVSFFLPKELVFNLDSLTCHTWDVFRPKYHMHSFCPGRMYTLLIISPSCITLSMRHVLVQPRCSILFLTIAKWIYFVSSGAALCFICHTHQQSQATYIKHFQTSSTTPEKLLSLTA